MSLEAADRDLIRVSVAVCLGDMELLRRLRREAGDAARCRAWREALLQCSLFAGFPRVIAALDVLEEEGGLGSPDSEDEADGGREDHRAGHALFGTIYRDQAERVRDVLAARHPALARWVEGHAYGRVLGRGGLSLDRRELLAVACLAATGLDRQLASHVRGALHCGATRAELAQTVETLAPLVQPEDLRRAERVLERFASPPGEPGATGTA